MGATTGVLLSGFLCSSIKLIRERTLSESYVDSSIFESKFRRNGTVTFKRAKISVLDASKLSSDIESILCFLLGILLVFFLLAFFFGKKRSLSNE